MELSIPPLVNTEKIGIIIRVDVTIFTSDVQRAIEDAAKDIGKKVAIPGFRKGKAPLRHVILNRKADVIASTANKLEQAGMRFVLDNNSDPASKPFLEPEVEENGKILPKEGDPYKFTFSYQVDPRTLLEQVPGLEQQQTQQIGAPMMSNSQFGPASTPAVEDAMKGYNPFPKN